MQNLTCNVSVKTSIFESNVEYNVKVPDFIMDVISESYANGMEVFSFIESKGIEKETALYKIIKKAFRRFPEFTDSINSFDVIKNCIKNGYVVKTKTLNGEISSLSPVVNTFDVVIEKINFKLQDEKQLKKELVKMAQKIVPDGGNFKIQSFNHSSSIEEKENNISFELQDGELTYNNLSVNLEYLDFKSISNENNLIFLRKKDSIDYKIPNDFEWVNEDSKQLSWSNTSDNNPLNFLIKDRNIEFTESKNWNGIKIWKTGLIRENEFKKDSLIYKAVLEAYERSIDEEVNKLQLNSFIFLEFLRNKEEYIISNIDMLIKKYVTDKKVLRIISLLDMDIKLPDTINTKYIEEIVLKATVHNISKIISKVSLKVRDKMLSAKLLNRLSSLDKNLLTSKQLEIVENEELKQQNLDDEFKSILGELSSSGIRENLKKIKKATRKIYKIDKRFKKFLDEYIGHNKGDTIVTVSLVQEARTILKKTAKVIEYMKNNG